MEYEKAGLNLFISLNGNERQLVKSLVTRSIDRSCAVHGNSFDANQKISRLSFDADKMEAKWLVLCHGFVTG